MISRPSSSYINTHPESGRTYPPRLWDIIFAYHALNKGKLSRALDIGCGPGVSDLASHLASWAWLHALTHKQAEADDKGFVALALASRVKSVRAIDPAQKMVDIGLQPDDPNARRIDYAVGTAEDLKAAKVGGVDLVVAGQAAHWFDYPKVWRQLSKCVRARGTVAFIVSLPLRFRAFASSSEFKRKTRRAHACRATRRWSSLSTRN